LFGGRPSLGYAGTNTQGEERMEHFFGFIFVLMTAGILLVGAVIFGFIKMFTKSGEVNVAREAQMIQEIYNGMSRMEERIEALETILLEKDGKEKRS